MPRDPLQGVINWFGWLMVAVFIASSALVSWVIWRLWLLAAALFGG